MHEKDERQTDGHPIFYAGEEKGDNTEERIPQLNRQKCW
jgi:hypothetical protein